MSRLNTVMQSEKSSGTLADLASECLVEAIVSGELAQGSKLSEAELANVYGISRGPLREALRRLEGMRLVVRIPHAGVRVCQLTVDFMQELYVVREALEGMAARYAAELITEEEVAELWQILKEHEYSIGEVSAKYYPDMRDRDFHFKIIAASRNNVLMNYLCNELYHLFRMSRYQTSHVASRTHLAFNEHRQIAQAIANRDGELAEMLMRRHVSGAWKTYKQLMLEGKSSK